MRLNVWMIFLPGLETDEGSSSAISVTRPVFVRLPYPERAPRNLSRIRISFSQVMVELA
jgi:hypothetical protein